MEEFITKKERFMIKIKKRWHFCRLRKKRLFKKLNTPSSDDLPNQSESMFLENDIYMNDKRIMNSNELEAFVIHIHDHGVGHKIYLHSTKGNGKIYINLWGNENTFIFGKDNVVNNDMSISYWGCAPNIFPKKVCVEIGNHNIFNGEQIKFICPIVENRSIKVGDYNLFGGYITFRGRNDHVIYDIKTMKRVNEDFDIILKNNIWVCDSVVFLPKCTIEGNAIIAEQSLVNKEFSEKNILIAGTPASIKKQNVMWNKNLDDSYKRKKAN